MQNLFLGNSNKIMTVVCSLQKETFLVVAFLIVLISSSIQKGLGKDDRHRQTYVVRYEYGDITIPVTVVLDYKKQTEHVINMNPRTPEKSITLYDFKHKAIAYKDLSHHECFLGRLRQESLQKEDEMLKELPTPIDTKPLILTLDSKRSSLTPTEVRNIAGQMIAVFCRRMNTWLLQPQRYHRRSRRSADQHEMRENARGSILKNARHAHEMHLESNSGKSAQDSKIMSISRNLTNSTATSLFPTFESFETVLPITTETANLRKFFEMEKKKNLRIRNQTIEKKNSKKHSLLRQHMIKNEKANIPKREPSFNQQKFNGRGKINFQKRIQQLPNSNKTENRSEILSPLPLRPTTVSELSGDHSYHRLTRGMSHAFYHDADHYNKLAFLTKLWEGNVSKLEIENIVITSKPRQIFRSTKNHQPVLRTHNKKPEEGNTSTFKQTVYGSENSQPYHSKIAQSALHFRNENLGAQLKNPIFHFYTTKIHDFTTEISNSEVHKRSSLHSHKRDLRDRKPNDFNNLQKKNSYQVRNSSLFNGIHQNVYTTPNFENYNFNLQNKRSKYRQSEVSNNFHHENRPNFVAYLNSANNGNFEFTGSSDLNKRNLRRINNENTNIPKERDFENHHDKKDFRFDETIQNSLFYLHNDSVAPSSTKLDSPVAYYKEHKDIIFSRIKDRSDTPKEEFIILNETLYNITKIREHSLPQVNVTFSIPNITVEEGFPLPHQRFQNVLKSFTPDEIIIDIGNISGETEPSTFTASFHRQPVPMAISPIQSTNNRTMSHEMLPKPPFIAAVDTSNNFKKKLNMHRPKEAIAGDTRPTNRKLFQNKFRPDHHKPQHTMSKWLPTGVSLYPRHPQAPYAELASPFVKARTVPMFQPTDNQTPYRHHWRHQRKRKGMSSPCCRKQQNWQNMNSCCQSNIGSCCTPRYRHDTLSPNCCPNRNPVNSSPHMLMPAMPADSPRQFAESATPAQTKLPAMDLRNQCEKEKMCRILYQSTQPVMVCRDDRVNSC